MAELPEPGPVLVAPMPPGPLVRPCNDATETVSEPGAEIRHKCIEAEPLSCVCDTDSCINNQADQGPHDWRRRLRPVKSPIKAEPNGMFLSSNGDGKDCSDERVAKVRQLPPWKRDLIERNKKVARLVRRESSGRSKRTAIVRRESSGKSKKSGGSESPSGLGKRKSFRNGSLDNAFTQQVVNENSGMRRRVSPANSFKNSGGVRRTPSDKVLDVNDPATKKRVERVRRARLYLLQQMGPNSFLIVGDSPEHKFKVIIGPQTCTCGKGPHCVHVLFVMLRVFQVSESDPCLWSRQLKNYEVENLFHAYNDKRTLKIEAKKSRRSSKPYPSTSRLPSPEEIVVPADSDAGSVREEDDTCPICLLEMLEGESLLKCAACQNKLHHHCITVWFDECKRQSEPLICPLCRTWWKETKGDDSASAAKTPLVPPNTRVSSPHQETDSTRLPYAEPIPGQYISLATPWIEVLGEDLVSCLFSRNWSIRESGLKHLGKEMVRELRIVNRDMNSGNSVTMEEAMVKLLNCCFKVVAFMAQDPVYRVFVGCLKVLRAVFSVIPSRDYHQRNKLQMLFRPVIDSIVLKCTDGNSRTGELSVSTMVELAKGQHGELALGTDITHPGELGLGGIAYLVNCLTEQYTPADITWQWLLGRLYIVERLVKDFPTEFLPRQRPDGASSESSLEMVGATSKDDEDRPENYDRLLSVAQFAVKAVSNQHARISRVAKRVFLLAARYAAHLESLITEIFNMINDLNYAHKKSLKRQLEKIVSDFQLSEQLGQHLRVQHLVDRDCSPGDTPSMTPVSSPKCTSPVTVQCLSPVNAEFLPPVNAQCPSPVNLQFPSPVTEPSEILSVTKNKHNNYSETVDIQSDSDYLNMELGENYGKLKPSKSLDDLDSVDCKPRCRFSKSAVTRRVKSRCVTPQKIGPVLETNLDDVIRLEEEARHRRTSVHSTNSVFDDNEEEDDDTDILKVIDPPAPPSVKNTSPLPLSPPPRLLSNDLETDIDTVELNIDDLIKRRLGSTDNLAERKADAYTLQLGNKPADKRLPEIFTTPKIPKSLTLDLNYSTPSISPKSSRSISPCAHMFELERKSRSGSPTGSLCMTTPSPAFTCLNTSNRSVNMASGEKQADILPRVKDNSSSTASRKSSSNSSASRKERVSKASYRSDTTDDFIDYMAMTPGSEGNKPVTFKTEVAMATPKHSPSHTLDKEDDSMCKEEVEKEEALALAKAMEVSAVDPPKPILPGLTPVDQEEVITIRIQPDKCDDTDCNGNSPTLYYENVHWKKGPLLGTGAFSTCYQARDIRTGTIMALKQISFCRNSRSEQETVIETITEEIHMMAKLGHPHIVRILGATRQGCHFNMFVEWMPGGSISYLLGHYGKFSEDVMTNYVLQILRGLAYLHDNHILHRDLKGANLLVDSTGRRLRIGDFGAAARLASKSTGAGEFQGQLLGTIAFMAPEVLRGENYGRVCDVWSVGCCLIEMATTKPPWNAHDVSNHLALIFKIANAQSTPPIPDQLSPPLRDLLLRCLEPVKDQRPSAKELLIHPLFTQYMQTNK